MCELIDVIGVKMEVANLSEFIETNHRSHV